MIDNIIYEIEKKLCSRLEGTMLLLNEGITGEHGVKLGRMCEDISNNLISISNSLRNVK